MTKYPDATSMSRVLLCRLRMDVKATEKDEDIEGVDLTLIFPESLRFWSEHSERGTMNTWMQIAGVTPEARRMVGRWSVSQEEEYLRNLEATVKEAQRKVARMIHEGPDSNSALEAFEKQVAEDLRRFLERRGVAEEKIQKQMDAIELPSTQPRPPQSVGGIRDTAWSLGESASLGFGDTTASTEVKEEDLGT